MTPEHVKARLAIEGIQDIEQLRKRTLDLLATVALMSRREEGNYEVVVNGGPVARGTKEFCIGFARGRDTYGEPGGPNATVMCGELQVWPDWGGATDT